MEIVSCILLKYCHYKFKFTPQFCKAGSGSAKNECTTLVSAIKSKPIPNPLKIDMKYVFKNIVSLLTWYGALLSGQPRRGHPSMLPPLYHTRDLEHGIIYVQCDSIEIAFYVLVPFRLVLQHWK